MIKIKHNFEKEKFMWLWSKYVKAGDDSKHCTNSIKGVYSKKFSKHNEEFKVGSEIIFDEEKLGEYEAIYICGVIKKGYSQKKNYEHNVHLAIIPKKGEKQSWQFEQWKVEIEGGIISKIISEKELENLSEKYKGLAEEYRTCRIFRWMVGFFK